MSKKPSAKLAKDPSYERVVYLRVSSTLHAALMSAAGAEQLRSGKKVSINNLASKLIANALGVQ